VSDVLRKPSLPLHMNTLFCYKVYPWKYIIFIIIIIIIIIIMYFHGVGPLVDPFRSHVSRSLFKGRPWFLLPVGAQYFITLGNLLRDILFTCCIQLLLYSSNLSKTGVFFLNPLQFVHLFCNMSKCILLFFSCISPLLLLFFWRHLL